MNMRFNFFTLLVYSPRGKSANALKSQRLLGSCKNGDIRFAEMLANKIISEKEAVFFENSVFIPIPRSTPLVMGAVFPAKTLAETLVSKGIGNTVLECLKRTKKIPKSSNQFSADERNSVQVHLDSLQITPLIIIEATEKSGTKHQGWEALRLGRNLFIMENVINDNSITWAKQMLEYGAEILTNENYKSIIEDIPYLTSKDEYAF